MFCPLRLPVGLHSVGSVVLSIVCARLSQLFLAHHWHFVKQARALRVPVFSVFICVRAQYVALLRFSTRHH